MYIKTNGHFRKYKKEAIPMAFMHSNVIFPKEGQVFFLLIKSIFKYGAVILKFFHNSVTQHSQQILKYKDMFLTT